MKHVSTVHLRRSPKQMRRVSINHCNSMHDLAALGITFDSDGLQTLQSAGFSCDAAGGFVTAQSVGTPLQFLQTFMPNAVEVLTQARKIDKIAGRTTVGNWYDEEIVQPLIEPAGRPTIYSDTAATSVVDYSVEYEARSVVRFEKGVSLGELERSRAEAMQQNPLAIKRSAVANTFSLAHNEIGFLGFNDGENKTYGLLNDPYLPAYVTATINASGTSTKWIDKTFEELTGDILVLASSLRVASGDLISPEDAACTLVVATSVMDTLNKANSHGMTVKTWIRENYKNWKIESAPEFDAANGGLNVCYLMADIVSGWGEEGEQPVVANLVPSAMHLVGVEKKAKGFLEAYTSATAGFIALVPFGIRRMTGI